MMHEIIGGDIFRIILMIAEKGFFVEESTLPSFRGKNTFKGRLNDFERAIIAYSFKLETNPNSPDFKKELISFEQKIERLSSLMWFSIFDRLNLWGEENFLGIEKGQFVVSIDPKIVTEAQKENKPKITEVNSFDELPEEIKNALKKMILSSESFQQDNLGKQFSDN